jgi:hypothetical protein
LLVAVALVITMMVVAVAAVLSIDQLCQLHQVHQLQLQSVPDPQEEVRVAGQEAEIVYFQH